MDMNNSTTPPNEQDFAQTPQWLVDAIAKWRGITFDLDVCAQPQTAKCPAYYCLAEGVDSLDPLVPWLGNNWCNPPYSAPRPWIDKARKHDGVTYMLIPDKPEVGWFRHAWKHAAEVWHFPFRVNFMRPDGTPFLDKKGKPQGPKFPVCLFIFDPEHMQSKPRIVDYVDLRVYASATDVNSKGF